MITTPNTPAALALLHSGAIALAQVEANGITIDVGYVERTLKQTERRVAKMMGRLKETEVAKVWQSTYGTATNYQSDAQLVAVLFDKMGFTSPGQTGKGRHRADEEALKTIDHPFINAYLEIKKLNKAAGTNLKGILREVVNGRLHNFFNLHTTDTFRSSSTEVNFQNIPIRDPEIGTLIRQAFIARPGRQLVEIDFSGAEVRVGACYHKDPRMVDYILDPTKDMHRDMAAECFILPPAAVPKAARQAAKGAFVFAQFYGDWFPNCARNLWKTVCDPAVMVAPGVTLREHMAAKGITELGELGPDNTPTPGSFMAHIAKVEKNFWGKRFAVYARWKKEWYEAYCERGWFEMLTGFTCGGYMRRNQAVNYPVQGSAFHCLLWSLIRLVNHELKKRKMGTLIVGQIHDSIVADAVPGELDEFLAIARYVMTVKLQRYFPWLIVPMEIEADVAPVGGSWAQKKGYAIHA